MIVQAKVRLYVPCMTKGCEGEWRADQLNINQNTVWSCDTCGHQFNIMRINEGDYRVADTGAPQEYPVVVTLRSVTKPEITLRLNSKRYTYSLKDSWEDYVEHQRYFYNEHTCPTNWFRDVEEIVFQKDKDPHGVFEFVSVEPGRLVDSPYGDGMIVEKA